MPFTDEDTYLLNLCVKTLQL